MRQSVLCVAMFGAHLSKDRVVPDGVCKQHHQVAPGVAAGLGVLV